MTACAYFRLGEPECKREAAAGRAYCPDHLEGAVDYDEPEPPPHPAEEWDDAPSIDLMSGDDGATFILDGPTELEARWGEGSNVLWAEGESLMFAAPTGVGKTTMTGQLVRALVGLSSEFLGLPVKPAKRVLYLAMDRPRQIRRSLRRQFAEGDREALRDRLVVRSGPLPADLAKNPDQLSTLAQAHGCDVVVVDSLKDAAVKLTDDEVGGNVNRAVQLCNAAGVDVLVLHHQRKGDGTAKPNTIADVYGSTWLTAGCGSVVLLWGEAGGELVDLIHLKQPADVVGPWKLEHDHIAGATRIVEGFDALAYLRNRGSTGATVAEAAQAEHGQPVKAGGRDYKRTERRLRRLERDGLARREGQSQGSGGTFTAARYYAVDSFPTVDATVDTGF